MTAAGSTNEAPSSPKGPLATKRAHFITFLGTLLLCLVAVVWMAGPYLLALFLGGTLAMLAYPAYRWLLSRKWRPRLAASGVSVLILLLIVAPLTVFSIVAVRQGLAIGGELAGLKEFSPKSITIALSRWEAVRTIVGDPAMVNARLKNALQSAGQSTTSAVVKLGEGIPAFLLQMTLAMIAFFFFLVDGDRFMDWLLGLGVLDRHVQVELVDSFRDTATSAVLAGLAAAASLAGLIASGYLILDVPGAFLAGGLTFIFAWIPLLGTAPALLAALLYLYVQGSPIKMAALVALGVIASIADHLIRPLVLKGRAGMHPLVGFASILGGIHMFGMLGVFLGPILAAMLLSLLKVWPVIGGRFGIDLTANS